VRELVPRMQGRGPSKTDTATEMKLKAAKMAVARGIEGKLYATCDDEFYAVRREQQVLAVSTKSVNVGSR